MAVAKRKPTSRGSKREAAAPFGSATGEAGVFVRGMGGSAAATTTVAMPTANTIQDLRISGSPPGGLSDADAQQAAAGQGGGVRLTPTRPAVARRRPFL